MTLEERARLAAEEHYGPDWWKARHAGEWVSRLAAALLAHLKEAVLAEREACARFVEENDCEGLAEKMRERRGEP